MLKGSVWRLALYLHAQVFGLIQVSGKTYQSQLSHIGPVSEHHLRTFKDFFLTQESKVQSDYIREVNTGCKFSKISNKLIISKPRKGKQILSFYLGRRACKTNRA